MKRFIVTGVLLLPLAAVQAGDWVVGANWGVAQGDTGAGEMNDELRARGLNATASSTDDSRTAWRFNLGYEFTPRLGVEFSYVDLGKVETTFTGTTADIDTFISDVSDLHPRTAKGWLLAGKYRQRVTDWAHLHGRLGMYSWTSDYTLKGGSASQDVSDSGIDPVIGVGVELGLDRLSWMPPGVSVGLDWERYTIEDEPITLLSLGLSYRYAY